MPAAHSPEFPRRALDLVAQGNPVAQTARDLGISESCLRNWMNRDAVDSGRKPGVTTDERNELVALRRRLRVEWIEANPEQVPLIVRVLTAAGNTGNDRVLRMLGEAMGRIQREPRRRDLDAMIVQAIEGLTEIQLEVLAACSKERRAPEEITAQLTGKVDGALVPIALANLLPRGFFQNPYGGMGGDEGWGLSQLGIAAKDAAVLAYPERVVE